jgi:hypothetical protein
MDVEMLLQSGGHSRPNMAFAAQVSAPALGTASGAAPRSGQPRRQRPSLGLLHLPDGGSMDLDPDLDGEEHVPNETLSFLSFFHCGVLCALTGFVDTENGSLSSFFRKMGSFAVSLHYDPFQTCTQIPPLVSISLSPPRGLYSAGTHAKRQRAAVGPLLAVLLGAVDAHNGKTL